MYAVNTIFNTENVGLQNYLPIQDYFYRNQNWMVKAVIIDDEVQPREVLQSKLKLYCPNITVIGTAENVETGFAICNELKPEVVFLDITMPGGNGFQLLKKYTKPPFEVIFSTAHSEYAIEAFKNSAVGYILKPTTQEDLISAVDMAISRLAFKNVALKYEALLFNLQPQNKKEPNIIIPSHDKYEVVKISEISYCEGSDRYTYVFTTDGRKIISSQNLGKFKTMLSESNFFVTHKSFVVNLGEVKSLTTDDEVILANGSKVPIARRRKQEFINALSHV